MERIASIMFLYPNQQEEYKKRHDELWPEMEQILKKHGISNYSIFLNEENDQLFAYLEVSDKAIYEEIANTAICKKWWEYMAPIMKSNHDNSPISTPLKEVFYLA